MKAYKFRSLSDHGIVHAIDIIRQQRLHCAEWSDLNDPMEGIFWYTPNSGDDSIDTQLLENIKFSKYGLRVCCLSTTYQNHLLWAHYANGFRGLAIEIDIPDNTPELELIRYEAIRPAIYSAHTYDPIAAARQILSSKHPDWEYEREVRLICEDKWFTLKKPAQRIIAGHRISNFDLDRIREVSAENNVPLFRIQIAKDGSLSASSIED